MYDIFRKIYCRAMELIIVQQALHKALLNYQQYGIQHPDKEFLYGYK